MTAYYWLLWTKLSQDRSSTAFVIMLKYQIWALTKSGLQTELDLELKQEKRQKWNWRGGRYPEVGEVTLKTGINSLCCVTFSLHQRSTTPHPCKPQLILGEGSTAGTNKRLDRNRGPREWGTIENQTQDETAIQARVTEKEEQEKKSLVKSEGWGAGLRGYTVRD